MARCFEIDQLAIKSLWDGCGFDFVMAVVALDALIKIVAWQKIHELRKEGSSCVHWLLLVWGQLKSIPRSSNRLELFFNVTSFSKLDYVNLKTQRWDSSADN